MATLHFLTPLAADEAVYGEYYLASNYKKGMDLKITMPLKQ